MTDFLQAKANEGGGTDQLAVEAVAGGIMPITKIHTGALGTDGGPVESGNPFHVADEDVLASLGTDGAAPPTIPGTGVRGWLRSIYDKLMGTIAVTVPPAGIPLDAATLLTMSQSSDPEVSAIAQQILSAVNKLAFLGGPARALDGSLRVQVSNTVAVTLSSGTLTTLTTLTNMAQIGGYAANPIVPAATNTACMANKLKMDA